MLVNGGGGSRTGIWAAPRFAFARARLGVVDCWSVSISSCALSACTAGMQLMLVSWTCGGGPTSEGGRDKYALCL
jgi:hypothetical protein